jgi:hypothetical protein
MALPVAVMMLRLYYWFRAPDNANDTDAPNVKVSNGRLRVPQQ